MRQDEKICGVGAGASRVDEDSARAEAERSKDSDTPSVVGRGEMHAYWVRLERGAGLRGVEDEGTKGDSGDGAPAVRRVWGKA